MDDYQLTWYIQDIAMHCYGASIYFNNLLEAISDPEIRQTRIVWFNLISFLSNTAMISKYISPTSPMDDIKQERKNRIIKALQINQNSPIFDRETRDNIEHFDERIDNWVKDDAKNIIEIVSDRNTYNFIVNRGKRIKRFLVMEELLFISENRQGNRTELYLEPLEKENQYIFKNAEKWLNECSPYHFIMPRLSND